MLTQLFTAMEHTPTILPAPNLNNNGRAIATTNEPMDIKMEEKK